MPSWFIPCPSQLVILFVHLLTSLTISFLDFTAIQRLVYKIPIIILLLLHLRLLLYFLLVSISYPCPCTCHDNSTGQFNKYLHTQLTDTREKSQSQSQLARDWIETCAWHDPKADLKLFAVYLRSRTIEGGGGLACGIAWPGMCRIGTTKTTMHAGCTDFWGIWKGRPSSVCLLYTRSFQYCTGQRWQLEM